MIEIPLTKGYVAIVDDEDADLAERKWTLCDLRMSKYASRQISVNGRKTTIKIHRVIVERMVGRKLESHEQVDHIDGDGLNNHRSNLRICTHQQNQWNKSMKARNKVGYKGVSKDEAYKTKPYRALISVNSKTIHLGRFATPEEAHAAYCEAGRKYFGEFFRAA